MSWYRGHYVFSKRTLAQWMTESKKDYHFRVRNKEQAETSVVKFVFSDNIQKDRRLYTACRTAYNHYLDYCHHESLTPLNNHNFKRNMELLGFVYQKHHRFYVGYYGNKVTTAYKNIGIIKR